jgi:ParB-like chromosome segregation protein Spo0J
MATRAKPSAKSPAPVATPTSAVPEGAAAQRLEVVHLPIGDLRPNSWNPNRVPPEVMHKLREYLRKEGLVQPLVVRRMADHHQILGGFHRWTICKDELGYTEIPCVVVDVDEKRAKLLTVNLNELSGDPVPHLMAALIHDLSRDTSIEDLSTILPYNEAELRDFEELLKLPDGLAAFVEEQIAKEKKDAPTVLTFVVERAEPVEAAVAHVVEGLEGKNKRGRALQVLAEVYLAAKGLPLPAAAAEATTAPVP